MVTVRRMEEKDIRLAGELEKKYFSMPWSENAFLEMLHQDYAYYYVAECQGTVIGICGLRNLAGEGEITNVVVEETYRCLGAASRLMERVLEDGNKIGITAFTLEVRVSNKPAVSLYKKFGFQSEGTRKNFYEKPTEDALVMWKR